MHILFLIKNAPKIHFLPWVYHYAYVDKVAQIVMQLLLRRVPTFTNTQYNKRLIIAGSKRTGGDSLSPLLPGILPSSFHPFLPLGILTCGPRPHL